MAQVSQSAKTLLEAVREGEVPRPALMGWNDWQVWRRDLGRRPLVAVDGSTTSTAQESALWKSTMLELYGAEWSIELVSAEVVREDPATQLSAPSAQPAADAGATGAAEVPPLFAERSPGSGVATGAASPGSGLGTPESGTFTAFPGRASLIASSVLRKYRPGVETLEKYSERLARQAAALDALDEPLAAGVLQGLLAKAKYELRLYEEAKDDEVRQEIGRAHV